MTPVVLIVPAAPQTCCTVKHLKKQKCVQTQTAPGESQPQSFPPHPGAPFQQVPSPVSRRAPRHFSPSPPACTSPLKYKIISTDISPNAAMRAPKSRFPGKWGGRHVWRLRARTALPPLTKNSTRGRARGHGPAYSEESDWPRRSSICTRDVSCLQ